ncbi:DNA polymerase subunit cdc27 domain-containing protein [Phthorimaea operculella]|nr:DNA polymerase subunit cdc27 domain-containing protein [Phthorimaea operculella]
MDEESLETNLGTIKEMVLDEKKLVTYVSLSKDLCIHVNDSKKLLKHFIDKNRKKDPNVKLNVNYIISGLSEGNKARTTVISENELGDIRNTMKTVFFEHIYSVSNGLASVDNVALLAVSKFEDLPLCTGLIKGSSCVKRSTDEIGSLKSNSQASVQIEPKPANPLAKKVKDESKKDTKPEEDKKNVTKAHESKSEPAIKTELPSPKKETTSNKPKADKKNNVKAQKGIAGFFGKSNSAPSKVISKNKSDEQPVPIKKEKSVEDTSKIKTEKMEVDEEATASKKDVKEKASKPEIKKEQVNGKSKNKSNEKLNDIKKNAKVDKKRKRVLHVSDSESDDEKDPFVDDAEQQDVNMSDDEIPPTPTVNTVKITSGIVNPKKRRKIVDKTYTDEDGYILTKKEEVYESCSDQEDEVSAKENVKAPPVNQVSPVKQETSPKGKKNGPKTSKKKISPPQKGKQATLMNFFKKV